MNIVTMRQSLQITPSGDGIGTVSYKSPVSAVQGTMSSNNGPTPGTIVATNLGTIVNLSDLKAFGGLAVFQNRDTVNPVEYGIYDNNTQRFYPLGYILAASAVTGQNQGGEQYVIRLSPNIEGEEPGTGTGTFGSTSLMFRSPKGTTVIVLVQVFEP